MSGIGPGEISEGISNVYNLVISTDSAHILADSFEPFFKKSFWEIWAPTFAAFLSFIAAGASVFVAWKTNKNSLKMQKQLLKISENSIEIQKNSLTVSKNSTQISHDLFINELDKLYFEIRQKIPISADQFTPKDKTLMCNFLEKICSHYFDKKISKKELLMFSKELENKSFIELIKKSEKLGNCKKWLKENNLIPR